MVHPFIGGMLDLFSVWPKLFQIQITLKNVIEIQNTKYILKVSKIQNTNYIMYFKYVFQLLVFQLLHNTAALAHAYNVLLVLVLVG